MSLNRAWPAGVVGEARLQLSSACEEKDHEAFSSHGHGFRCASLLAVTEDTGQLGGNGKSSSSFQQGDDESRAQGRIRGVAVRGETAKLYRPGLEAFLDSS